jgi:tRNA A-37 threonylcarbamoyl transferase component Bud32
MQEHTLTTIGPYEVVRKIARGGMAVVYLARQPGLDRTVALKELAAFPQEEPELAARFVHEARVAGSLTHPNIVTTHDFFVHEDRPYIAMEYLENGSLRPIIRNLSLAQVAGVLEGTLAALSFAAALGIVHRDVKPENVLVATSGSVKLTDFGIAKALNSVVTSNFRTKTNTTIGTPAYMAPEQALSGEASIRSDLYAVGVMAYEMLARRLPFGNPTDTPTAILLGHVRGEYTPPNEVDPSLDRRVAAWVERLLSKEPEDRPSGPSEAWQELENAVVSILGPMWRREAALPTGAPETLLATDFSHLQASRRVTPGASTIDPVTVATTQTADAVAPPGRRGRRRRAALAAGALVAAGAVAALGATTLASSTPVLDVGPIEHSIRHQVAFQQPVTAVHCPTGVPRVAGTRFACNVTLAPGHQSLVAIVRERDARGNADVRIRLG